MNIVPLSKGCLEETIKMAVGVFADDVNEEFNPERSLRTSLKFKENPELLEKSEMQELDCWILLKDDANEVIGLTGLYRRKSDPSDLVWLSWYCIRADERGKGGGKKLLEWTIENAKTKGYKRLKLYTSDDPNEVHAQELYEKLGFKIVGEETRKDYNILYREKIL